jgi:hypothetical protein
MKTELIFVTPKTARDWLKKNESNRPLRPGVVERLHSAFERGEWKVTHQGIAFATSGRLLDGQHRLTFISQLPEDAKVAINVTTGQDESTFDAIDIGVGRTMGDVYGISAELAATGRFFAKIANSSTAFGLTNQFAKPFVDWVTPEFEELVTFCPKVTKIWSSAPVRCAAIYQMKRGHDADFIKVAYHSLVHADIESMPFAAQALMRQYMSGKIVSARTQDLFCRAIRAFDSTNTKRVNSIAVHDQAASIAKFREFIESDMQQAKKSPVLTGLKVAKPSSNFNWNRAA